MAIKSLSTPVACDVISTRENRTPGYQCATTDHSETREHQRKPLKDPDAPEHRWEAMFGPTQLV